MKINFKKIASVIAGAVMLGSTASIALAANYPAPFVVSGAADAAIVVTSGTHAGATSDWAAAVDIQSALQGQVTTTSSTTGASAAGGDSVKIEKSTNKLNMNNAITDVWTTKKITDDDLGDLLADGIFTSTDNVDYTYEQYITLAENLNLTHFADNDYNDKEPAVGVRIDRNVPIFNYTLEFTKYPRTDVDSNGRLEDIQDRDINILGKTYKLLNAYNASTNTKLELMKGATTSSVNLNEEKTLSIGDKSYTVSLVYVDSTYTQFTVTDSEGNTQTTTKLAKGGTYKLKDTTQLGVTDISYQNFAGGVMSAELSLGAEKITIENSASLKINEDTISDITCYISRSEVAANKVDLTKIILEWKGSDRLFVTDTSSATMAGLGSIKISAGEFTTPKTESVKIDTNGNYGIELTIPIKDGDAKVDILYGNGTTFTHIADDSDSTGFLRTSDVAGEIVYDMDTDNYFFATWNSSTAAESYLLKVESITEDTSVKKNYTAVKNVVTGQTIASNKKQDDQITIGNVVLTVNAVNKNLKTANFTINAGGTFNRVYTKEGLTIWLPYNSTLGTQTKGAINTKASNETNATSWLLHMAEEDKDGTLGKGKNFNITLGFTGDKAEVKNIDVLMMLSSGAFKERGTTKIYEGYLASDLATEIIYNQPSGSADTAEVIYHGGESYGNVFFTALGVEIVGGSSTSSSGGNVMVVKDSEVSTVQNKNLIVVGGSCINTVAAKILGSSTPICGDDFTTKTKVGVGQYLVKSVASPYNADKTAVLVAGYDAADTKNAVAKLKESAITDKGTETVYPVASA